MFDPVTAAIGAGSAVISGGLGLIGAGQQASAAERSAELQAEAARRAQQLGAQQYAQTREDLSPWRQAGQQALGRLSGALGGELTAPITSQFQQPGHDPYSQYQQFAQPVTADVTQDPGYQFRLQQGQEAIEGGAAARGGLFSGQTGRELMQFGQELGSQEYGRAYDRAQQERLRQQQAYGQAFGQDISSQQSQLAQRQNLYNMLSGTAGMGQQSAGQLGTLGAQQSTMAGQYGMQGAQAIGTGGQQAAGFWSGGLQNVGNQLTGLGGQYAQYRMMHGLLG